MIQDGAEFEAWQTDSSDEFYAVDGAFLRGVAESIEQCGFIDFLFSVNPSQSRGSLMDFGAGRGILAGAAAKYFHRVYAADLSLNVLRKVHDAMPGKEKIIITDTYENINSSFDCVTAMHVLEHLPNLLDVVEGLVKKLNHGGTLFFQVPMLRNDYLLNVHYTFFNEVAARALCRNLGLEVLGVWFDHKLDFLTCIGKKSK